jgi:hypothetical protein
MSTVTRRLVLLVLAVGFLALLVETRYHHRFLVAVEPKGWIPVVASALLFAASLAVMAGRDLLRKAAACAYALGALVGLVGLYYHTDGLRPAAFARVIAAERREHRGPPALAPLGLSGLALIGLILTLERRRPP